MISILMVTAAASSAFASPARDRAKQRYLAGEAAFKLGRFREALDHYTRAYQLDAHPDMLFNIAQCHRNMGHYDDAIFFLERYLVDTTSIEDREQIESLIRDLEQRRKLERVLPPAPAPVPPPQPERMVETRIVTTTVTEPVYVETPLHQRGWFWGLVIGASAAVGGAVALAVWSQRDRIPDGQYEYDLR